MEQVKEYIKVFPRTEHLGGLYNHFYSPDMLLFDAKDGAASGITIVAVLSTQKFVTLSLCGQEEKCKSESSNQSINGEIGTPFAPKSRKP